VAAIAFVMVPAIFRTTMTVAVYADTGSYRTDMGAYAHTISDMRTDTDRADMKACADIGSGGTRAQ
jgi:hypothetical protein